MRHSAQGLALTQVDEGLIKAVDVDGQALQRVQQHVVGDEERVNLLVVCLIHSLYTQHQSRHLVILSLQTH